MQEFHISQNIRRRYQLDDGLFQTDGNILFANFQAARKFVQKINERRDADFPESGVHAGDLQAMGLIDEIFHFVIGLYKKNKNSQAARKLLEDLNTRFKPKTVDRFLLTFMEIFPPSSVYREELTPAEYLNADSDGINHREALLEEVVLIWLANHNPAYRPFKALFNDESLAGSGSYVGILQEMEDFFKTQPGFGPQETDLLQMLRSPTLAVPGSIRGQLEYIQTHWGYLLSDFLMRILSSLDFLKEEQKLAVTGPGPVEIPLYDFSQANLLEGERYSRDSDWMPSLVLIAKNSYVWLHQLRIKYQQPIWSLSDIPDEELQLLAQRGINGLWLIGLWERSQASAHIKQLCGNPEAIASAYALFDYQIAADLGGQSAFEDLDRRARRFGIRLASDMVPNHMAIDSRWVMDHPDWFISLSYSPFPSYRFSGPDLSERPDVGLFIDDHYYDRSDAAVVFKRVDRHNNTEQYIYHGNDGTSFPWNDTAQLNYLKAEVREAVIQTILEVARRFHVIRFDAAMTLTRRHFHRLWFPQPGSGGDIPSRAEHAMTEEEFTRAMPNEFWREVVDRVATEAPDTLLLAEAFWLMESYFVRTLGMHRVYNSAFMNLLRDEDNAKYRALMKNTLEFDPDILKRFVNFLNNPDERTAIDQFGNGDKYFGVCMLMVTLPGLPMFGHGQIEGFTEKYGMEYRRAYHDETPDDNLVRRHEREIFPLLHKRYLFANVEHFLLYDFFTPQGFIDENVYAYSNRAGNETALILYNNRYECTRGWVRTSVGYLDKQDGNKQLVQKPLGDGLAIHDNPQMFTIFKDLSSGLEYLRKNSEIRSNGLYFELNGYQAQVLLNFRQVTDESGDWSRLHSFLDGRGTASMDDAFFDLRMQPVLQPLRQMFNKVFFDHIINTVSAEAAPPPALAAEVRLKVTDVVNGISAWLGTRGDGRVIDAILSDFSAGFYLIHMNDRLPPRTARALRDVIQDVNKVVGIGNRAGQIVLFSWIFLHRLGELSGQVEPASVLDSWMDEWRLGRLFGEFLPDGGPGAEGVIQEQLGWLRQLIARSDIPRQWDGKTVSEWVQGRLNDPQAARLLNLNRYEGVVWFSKEGFEKFCGWLEAQQILTGYADETLSASESVETLLKTNAFFNRLNEIAQQAGFQAEKFFSLLASSAE